MYSEQEREHLDYEMGSASELQNAYALSCMERKPDDRGKVNELLRVGRYVVVTEIDLFCPRTDAGMGVHVALEGDYTTRNQNGAGGQLQRLRRAAWDRGFELAERQKKEGE